MSILSKLSGIAAAAAMAVISGSAYAGSIVVPRAVPEPGTWALVGLAAAVGYVVTRNKRK